MKTTWLAVLLPFFLIGCASTKYTWKGYDETLYRHYKNPQEGDKFIEELKRIVAAGEKKGNVPPGVHAECGYALYEVKRYDEAAVYFAKEHDQWPESRVLMERMLDAARTMADKNKAKDGQP